MAQESLEKRIERLEAVKEINDVMGKYEYYHCTGRHPETVDLFAKRDDTFAQVLGGVYKGFEGIERCYAGLHVYLEGNRKGRMYEHLLTTPIVEVAGDGKTAKVVWMSPGHETRMDEKTGKAQPKWCFLKYANDFIKEDGKWKIWHLSVLTAFVAQYDKSWAEGGRPAVGRWPLPEIPPELGPDTPNIIRSQVYNPNEMREFLPVFPEPYETYDETIGVHWIDRKITRKEPVIFDMEEWKRKHPKKP